MDKENQKIFTSICANYEPIECAFSETSVGKVDFSGELGVILYRGFDDGVKAIDFNGKVDAEAIKQFIDAHRFPIISEFD